MSANIFDIPDPLVAQVTQASALGQNTLIANRLLENPVPQINTDNGTLDKAQIALVVDAIDTHYTNAVEIAGQWQQSDPVSGLGSVRDLVVTTLQEFERFAQHVQAEYGKLVQAAYEKDETRVTSELERFKSIIEMVLANTKGAKTAVQNYQNALDTALQTFDDDFPRVLAQVGAAADKIGQLKAKISSLESDIAANNAAVINTVIDTAGTELVQGVTLASKAAAEDLGGTILAGVQMGVAYVKGLKKVIELNQKTLDDILAIRKAGLSIGEDELILVQLMNIGTMLSGLGATRGLSLDIVGDIIDWWDAMDTAIGNVLQQGGAPSGQIDTTNYSPATVDRKNPDFPPWNVILPTEHASVVFDKVMTVTPMVFDDDTVFEVLGSNAAMA